MLKHILRFSLLLLVIGAVAIWYVTRPDEARLSLDATTGKTPELTPIRYQIFPTIGIAEASSWPAGAVPKVAAGMTVTRFADKLDHPRSMLLLPNGDLLVAETNSQPRQNKGIEGWVMRNLMGMAGAGTKSPDRIVLLRDADKDGKAEERHVLIEGLKSPFGMVLLNDRLYVANTDAILAFPFTAGQTKIGVEGRKIANLSATQPNNHWSRNLIASADGKKLYVAVGSSSNIAEHGLENERMRANVLELDLATGKLSVFSAGLRNPVGLAFEPVTGELWTVVNERDMLGSDMVPDYLARVEFGTHYGWPWHFWGGYTDPRVEPKNPDHRQYERRPDFGLGAHVAALGLGFVPADSLLGADYAGDAIIARHGSWNRKPLAGYDVVRVRFDARGNPEGKPEVILNGFLSKDEKAMGRPTMVAFDATGGLLVSDDVGGVIWRVTAAAPASPRAAKPAPAATGN